MWLDMQGALASGLALGKCSIAAANARPSLDIEPTIPCGDRPLGRADVHDLAKATLLSLCSAFGERHMISLPARGDRRARVARDLGRIGLTPDRPGIRPFEAMCFDDAGGFPSAGVRGCFNSHLALMRRCAESGRTMLVMEDDIRFLPETLARFAPAAGMVSDMPWDIAYLGYLNNIGSGLPGVLEPFQGNTIGGHFYAVRPDFAAAMADFMTAAAGRPAGSLEGGPMYRDGAFNFYLARDRRWRAMVTGEPLALQASCRSDLTPGRFDSMPGARPLIRLVRRFGEAIA